MSNLVVVARREFRETVRKKSFLIWTVLTPLLFGAVMVVPALLMSRGSDTKRVLVLDGTRLLEDGLEAALAPSEDSPRRMGVDQTRGIALEVLPSDDVKGDAERAFRRLRADEIDVVVEIPEGVLADDGAVTYYSRSATDVVTRQIVSSAVNRAVIEQRVRARGIESEEAKRLLRRVTVSAVQITRAGQQKRGGDADLFLAIAFAMLLIVPTIFHGREIMTGIVLEKSERIMESLVSSVRAFDLLTGKVLGLAAVGLTQIAIWSAMGAVTSAVFAAPLVGLGVHALDLVTPSKLGYFVVFFLLGYLINACVFAIGGACSNTEKEAQQLTQPIVFALMLPWFLIGAIVTSPDSTLATVLSLVPVYTPITMFMRIVVGEPPLWQVATSIALSFLSMLALFWMAARIFRVGILWYGKRPSIPEFVRWMRQP